MKFKKKSRSEDQSTAGGKQILFTNLRCPILTDFNMNINLLPHLSGAQTAFCKISTVFQDVSALYCQKVSLLNIS